MRGTYAGNLCGEPNTTKRETTILQEMFQQIPILPFVVTDGTDPLSFHYDDKDAVILGKPMKEHLKFALSWWHTLCAEGDDMFGAGTADKTFGSSADPIQEAGWKDG